MSTDYFVIFQTNISLHLIAIHSIVAKRICHDITEDSLLVH